MIQSICSVKWTASTVSLVFNISTPFGTQLLYFIPQEKFFAAG